MPLESANQTPDQNAPAAAQGDTGGAASGRQVPTMNDLAGQQGQASQQTPPANNGQPAPTGSSTPAEGQLIPESGDQAQETADPFLSELQQFGFENLTDRAEAERRLLDSYREMQGQAERAAQLEQQIQFMQQTAMYGGMAQHPMNQGAVQAGSSQARQPAPFGFDTFSSIDQAAISAAAKYRKVVTENGQDVVQWAPNTPAAVREQFERAEAAVEQWQAALLTKPHETIPQLVAHYAAPLIEQQVSARLAQIEEQRRFETTLQENPWMLQIDPKTNRPARDARGQFIYSEAGQQVLEGVNSLFQAGCTDPQLAWQYAMNSVRPMVEQRNSQRPATPRERAQAAIAQRQANQTAVLRGAGPGPSNSPQANDRANSFSQGDLNQNEEETFGRDFQRAFKYALANGAN